MKKKWKFSSNNIAPYILLLPFLFWIVVFFGYAFSRVLYFSLTRYDLFSKPEFVGIANYINLFKEYLFARALKNSLTFAVLVTALQTIFALILAVILNRKIRGIKFFRAAYYMPSVTSSVVITLIFMWLFQRQGIINYLLTIFKANYHIIGYFILIMVVIQSFMVLKEKFRNRPVKIFEPSYMLLSFMLSFAIIYFLRVTGVLTPHEIKNIELIWLNTRKMIPDWAGPLAFPRPLGAVMLLNIWTTVPTFMLLYLAGLQDIPNSLFEAAEVDGATGIQKFIYIIIPQLKHITFLVVTMGLIGTLQMFDQVAIIGDQAPIESTVTLAYYVYRNMFPSSANPKIGFASAAALVLAVITLIVVYLQKSLTGEVRD
ncbi:MAG: sugar ABC transporter permease [Halanaerobiales bacterium]|nr:sugar ABC transporter permease [Halanaerobiales bacterium]